jgi:hypothetical protein
MLSLPPMGQFFPPLAQPQGYPKLSSHELATGTTGVFAHRTQAVLLVQHRNMLVFARDHEALSSL